VIDYTSTDFEAEVMRLTNGEGVNVAMIRLVMTQWREPSHRPNGAARSSPLANHQGHMPISKSPIFQKGLII